MSPGNTLEAQARTDERRSGLGLIFGVTLGMIASIAFGFDLIWGVVFGLCIGLIFD